MSTSFRIQSHRSTDVWRWFPISVSFHGLSEVESQIISHPIWTMINPLSIQYETHYLWKLSPSIHHQDLSPSESHWRQHLWGSACRSLRPTGLRVVRISTTCEWDAQSTDLNILLEWKFVKHLWLYDQLLFFVHVVKSCLLANGSVCGSSQQDHTQKCPNAAKEVSRQVVLRQRLRSDAGTERV